MRALQISLSYVIVLGVLCMLHVQRGSCQLRFETTHEESDSATGYAFTALSGFHDLVVAAAHTVEKASVQEQYALLLSADGGTTWREVDPGLPRPVGSAQVLPDIDQIDSLDIVAVGDSGLVVRTTDGGETWVRRDLPSRAKLIRVSFSDAQTGIVISAGLLQAHTTSDGGRTWSDLPLSLTGFTNCLARGNGKYRIFCGANGIVYSTANNGATFDSTSDPLLALPDSIRSRTYLTDCDLTHGDTLLLVGTVQRTNPARGIILRSTDNGGTWTPVYQGGDIEWIQHIASNGEGILVAFGQSASQRLLVSKDVGLSWSVQPIKISPQHVALYTTAAYMPSDGRIVACFSDLPLTGSYGILAKAQSSLERVESYERIVHSSTLTPNPASRTISVETVTPRSHISIYDLIGKLVLAGMTNEQGSVTFDISRLQDGAYEVILNLNDRSVRLGGFVKN